MNPESLVIPRDGFRHSFNRRLEVLMTRVDVEPLLQDVVRRQLRELFDDRGLMRMFRADQDAMPLPPASPGWFDQEHHLATEQVDGQSTEHPLGEEAGVVLEDLKDPFVVERFHLRFATANLSGSAPAALDGFVDRFRQLPTASYLEIEGHTDATGPAPYSPRLRLERAESVRRYPMSSTSSRSTR